MSELGSATQFLRGEHIAHVIETAGPGGAERMLAELARAQQQHGAVATAFLPYSTEEWLPTQLRLAGVSVERFHLDSPLSWRSVRTLTSAFRRLQVTLLHSHEFTMAVNGAVAARSVGIPNVITMHGGRYYADKLRRRMLLRGAIAGSQALVAVSDALADDLSRDLHVARPRIITIPNGVRLQTLPAAGLRAELGIAANTAIVLAVGNLYPVKGHATLLAALATLPPNAHVVIAGRGAEAEPLLARAALMGLGDRLHLLGHRDDVTAVLRAADVFVQPSLAEGLPLAVLEAMFAGAPIVASDVGDIAQAIGPDAGLIVPAGDALALSVAITRLLEQPFLARALGASAHARAERQYGITRAVERYAEVYSPLLAARDEASRSPWTSAVAQRSMRPNTSANTGGD
jgi:glycosyltransferase involved in cell wall biosynthesis